MVETKIPQHISVTGRVEDWLKAPKTVFLYLVLRLT
jgi:hypothetical protein